MKPEQLKTMMNATRQADRMHFDNRNGNLALYYRGKLDAYKEVLWGIFGMTHEEIRLQLSLPEEK